MKLICALSTILLLSLLVLTAVSASETPLHLNRNKLPYGCGSCHVGFDFRSGGGPSGCLTCHTNPNKIPRGLLGPGIQMQDMQGEFRKTYHHPSMEGLNVHRSNEELPEVDPRAPRHADCVDCHNPHYLAPANPLAGIRGKKVGNFVSSVKNEYELCYKCHAESANLPARLSNKKMEFSLSNPSFHPVEGEGKNMSVVSLIKPYKEKKVGASDVAVISCTTCHGSDNPDAPRGPHGSSYQHILVENYSTKDGEAESPQNYALCYRCHSRTSILGDESFRYHALHIQGKGSNPLGANGTSCYTCHNSHGSSEYRYLIKFNKDVVSPNSMGLLKFVERGVSAFHGECYLSCHGVDHNPKSY